MARIVQDSDDELEDDLEADLPPPKRPDASGQWLPLGGPADAIKGPSEQARPAHAQLQPSQDEPQSSVSLPELPNKTRKTDTHPSPAQFRLSLSPKKKSPLIYSKDTHPPGATWTLEGTMRDDYARHEPGMFAEPSSTIPNATMTQQRVLDVVNAPVMLGQEPETGGPYYLPPPEASVPWSDLMRFTPAEATEQTESSGREPPPDMPFTAPLATPQKDPGLSSSQGGRRTSSLHPKESRLTNKPSPVEIYHGEREPVPPRAGLQPITEIPIAARPESQSSEQVGAKITSRHQNSQLPSSSDDELIVVGLPEERYKPRPSRSRSLKIDMEQSIDYSVRPEKAKRISKRRRATADMGPANTFTTPEKVRQICDMGFTPATTAGALKRNCGDVIQTIDWLVANNVGHDELAPQSPPTTKPKPRKADEPHAMHVETVQDIMRNLNEYRRDDGETGQGAPPAMPDTDNATMQDGFANIAATTSNAETTPNTSPVKVQVVIPKKSPNASTTQAEEDIHMLSNKAKRRKTTLDTSEAEAVTTPVNVTEVVTEKKKGRGRPKKTASPAPTVKHVKISEQDTKEEKPSGCLQSVEPNSATDRIDGNSGTSAKKAESLEPMDSESAAHFKPLAKPCATAGSDTPERSTKPATASPMNKNKVQYRVGLSKRARIAPLLRTLKK
ncbi:hypothetical protein ACJQWK_04997 [Exserohilum turcicum]